MYSTYVKAVLKIKITTRVANRETRSVLIILTILTELLRLARQFVRSLRLLLLLLHIAIEFSLGGSSFYTSTEKTNKNKYNIKKQSGKEADRQNTQHERKNVIFECVTSGYIPTAVSVPSYYSNGNSTVLLALKLIPLFQIYFLYNNASSFANLQRNIDVSTFCV